MGCDIHTYVEYAQKRDGTEPYWQNFTRNGGSRNYLMFGILAGVRVPGAQLFEPRGMPEGELGWDTSEDYWTLVAPAEHPEWADDDKWVSVEMAERWVAEGSSIGVHHETGRLRKVSGPDWHTHSHLTADELEQALAHYEAISGNYYLSSEPAPTEWHAMLAAMRAFEARDMLTRVVFWFDN